MYVRAYLKGSENGRVVTIVYTYEFLLSLCKIVRSSVILLLPLFLNLQYTINYNAVKCLHTIICLFIAYSITL